MGRVVINVPQIELINQFGYFFQCPHMVCDPCFHCGGYSQCPVNPPEIVPHEMESYCRGQILDLLAKRVRQSGEPSHSHAHREVLSLDVARGDLRLVGSSGNNLRPRAGTLRRTVSLLPFRLGAV